MAQYADIIEIVAPSEAVEGSRVDITVRIKNLASVPGAIMAVAFHSAQGSGEYIEGLYPEQQWYNVPAGATQSFPGYFTMPSVNITITAKSYYWGADSQWHFDDQMNKSVSVTQLTPAFSGFAVSDYSKL